MVVAMFLATLGAKTTLLCYLQHFFHHQCPEPLWTNFGSKINVESEAPPWLLPCTVPLPRASCVAACQGGLADTAHSMNIHSLI